MPESGPRLVFPKRPSQIPGESFDFVRGELIFGGRVDFLRRGFPGSSHGPVSGRSRWSGRSRKPRPGAGRRCPRSRTGTRRHPRLHTTLGWTRQFRYFRHRPVFSLASEEQNRPLPTPSFAYYTLVVLRARTGFDPRVYYTSVVLWNNSFSTFGIGLISAWCLRSKTGTRGNPTSTMEYLGLVHSASVFGLVCSTVWRHGMHMQYAADSTH